MTAKLLLRTPVTGSSGDRWRRLKPLSPPFPHSLPHRCAAKLMTAKAQASNFITSLALRLTRVPCPLYGTLVVTSQAIHDDRYAVRSESGQAAGTGESRLCLMFANAALEPFHLPRARGRGRGPASQRLSGVLDMYSITRPTNEKGE